MRTHKTLSSSLFLAGLTLSLGLGLTRADETRVNTAEKPATIAQQPGGLLPGETRDQKRERLLKGIEAQVGPLSTDQKTHILAVLAAAGDEMAAARGNSSLTAEQQEAVVRRVHADIVNRISPALTEEQRGKLRVGRSSQTQGPDETPEQRRARILKRYEEALPDLTEAQKTRIVAVLDAAGAQMKALRADTTLNEEQRRSSIRKVHNDAAGKIDAVLTEAQRATWHKAREGRRGLATQQGEGGLLPGETREQKRARLLKRYEEVLNDLTIDQKTRILAVMEAAGDEMRAAEGNAALSPAQKQDAVRRVHAGVGDKIDAILTVAQRARWRKARNSQTALSSNAQEASDTTPRS